MRACANARTSCVRRAPALARGRFHSRPRRFCSQPSWRRRVGPVPGGHRFGLRLIPGNKTLQPVPSEPFVPKTQKRAFSCGKVLVRLNGTSTGTNMPHRELLTESQRLSLQAPASDERGMVRHYMLSSIKLDQFWAERLPPSRKGTRWDLILQMLCIYRFIEPGSE